MGIYENVVFRKNTLKYLAVKGHMSATPEKQNTSI